jgi:hypothetical protein
MDCTTTAHACHILVNYGECLHVLLSRQTPLKAGRTTVQAADVLRAQSDSHSSSVTALTLAVQNSCHSRSWAAKRSHACATADTELLP